MVIVCDSREKQPLVFEGCETVRGGLPIFDYALFSDFGFAVERKSLKDFVSSVALQKNFARELRKLSRARAAGFPRLFYVLDCNREDIEIFDFSRFKNRRVTPQFIYRQLSILEYVHGVHCVFSGDVLGAARDICRLLKRRAEDLKAQEGDQ
jgi:ERCC4-type nuclease